MIKIICVGKIKEEYLKALINDYLKRINRYHRIEIIELKDSNIDDERELILKSITDKDYLIGLDINGIQYNSIDFSKKIDSLFIYNSNLVFVIGGSDGLHQDIKDKCQELISFSKLTFPHGLFRGILLEQIYRAFKINNHEKYHK